MSRALQGSRQTRFGDTPLTFGMERFASGERVLWRFEVHKYCGRNPLISVDIDPKMLREMRAFIDQAIELVNTDGGRNTEPGERA